MKRNKAHPKFALSLPASLPCLKVPTGMPIKKVKLPCASAPKNSNLALPSSKSNRSQRRFTLLTSIRLRCAISGYSSVCLPSAQLGRTACSRTVRRSSRSQALRATAFNSRRNGVAPSLTIKFVCMHQIAFSATSTRTSSNYIAITISRTCTPSNFSTRFRPTRTRSWEAINLRLLDYQCSKIFMIILMRSKRNISKILVMKQKWPFMSHWTAIIITLWFHRKTRSLIYQSRKTSTRHATAARMRR